MRDLIERLETLAEAQPDLPSEDRTDHPTVIEYAIQGMGKRKQSPKTAARNTVKKLGGTFNLFLGPVIAIIDPDRLETLIWERMADIVIKRVDSMREGKEHYALDGTLHNFKQGKSSRKRLKKTVIAKLGRNPFTNDDQ